MFKTALLKLPNPKHNQDVFQLVNKKINCGTTHTIGYYPTIKK
jgi:hypothetical protein